MRVLGLVILLCSCSTTPARPIEAIAEACNAGDDASCVALYEKNDVATQRRLAVYYGRVCASGDWSGCDHLSQLYRELEGKTEEEQIRALFRKECQAGRLGICCYLGSLIHDGEAAKAARYYRRACAGGRTCGCTSLAGLHLVGRGVDKDPALAVELSERACRTGDADACGILASWYEQGIDLPRNRKKAINLYLQACKQGEAYACKSYAKMIRGTDLASSAQRLLKSAEAQCRSKDGVACYQLGLFHWGGIGSEIQTFPSAFVEACELGVPAACLKQARQYGECTSEGAAKSGALYRQVCDLGEHLGCVYLGRLLERGWGLPKDLLRAAELYKSACEGGEPHGCFNLGALYQTGAGFERDPVLAESLLKRACDGGVVAGCRWIRASYRCDDPCLINWSRQLSTVIGE